MPVHPLQISKHNQDPRAQEDSSVPRFLWPDLAFLMAFHDANFTGKTSQRAKDLELWFLSMDAIGKRDEQSQSKMGK